MYSGDRVVASVVFTHDGATVGELPPYFRSPFGRSETLKLLARASEPVTMSWRGTPGGASGSAFIGWAAAGIAGTTSAWIASTARCGSISRRKLPPLVDPSTVDFSGSDVGPTTG